MVTFAYIAQPVSGLDVDQHVRAAPRQWDNVVNRCIDFVTDLASTDTTPPPVSLKDAPRDNVLVLACLEPVFIPYLSSLTPRSYTHRIVTICPHSAQVLLVVF